MVYVNNKKFACESCIKGHRSSSCHHTDRPLFEIKKKGRPVSQCSKCRELRQSKKFHSKCTCNHPKESTPAVQPLASSSTSKTRRFIPIIPALPNGLKDVLSSSSSSGSLPSSRQRVDSLLNPCDCNSLWACTCNKSVSPADDSPQSESAGALSTLAQAAAMFSASSSMSKDLQIKTVPDANERSHQTRSQPTSSASTLQSNEHYSHASRHSLTPGPNLPPILFNSSSEPPPIVDFPTMPPMSEITSLAGTGCTCGLQCSCPGCVEHRGPQHVNHDHRDCADGCGTCVDPSTALALPNLSNATTSVSSLGTSFLDLFFARAAALPPPPSGSQSSTGSVRLPKLECCGGLCNCPNGHCSCRTSCVGCCLDKEELAPSIPVQSTSSVISSRSCCGAIS